MNNGAIRLVCFDLGGVLVRICRSWREACDAAGLDHRRVDPWGDASPETHVELLDRHQTGRITLEEYAREFCRATGIASPREVMAVHAAWILGEYDGVGEVIDTIHLAGLETASLSNTTADHWEQLLNPERFPVISRLKHRWASHLLGLRKPDPAVYRAFEARVGCFGGEILFFDDLEENVAAARDAGWNAVQVDHTRCSATQIAAALQRHGVAIGRSS